MGRIAIQDLEQTRAQYELFRAQRITALGQVLDNERQLRGLLGLPIEDGTRIVPGDQPVLAKYNPDWYTARDEAIALRPELILARQDLKFRQLDLIGQKNLLKPDLRFFATYDVNGLGTRLDGSEVRRLAHHRSRPFNAYGWMPRASISRDGSRVVFSSNYGLQAILGYPYYYSDAYLIDLSRTAPSPPGSQRWPARRYEETDPAVLTHLVEIEQFLTALSRRHTFQSEIQAA